MTPLHTPCYYVIQAFCAADLPEDRQDEYERGKCTGEVLTWLSPDVELFLDDLIAFARHTGWLRVLVY